MDWNERKILFNYLRAIYLKESKYGIFVILNTMYAENKANKKIDELSMDDQLILLNKIKN